MRVSDALSVPADVTSGVIQGSTLGPALYGIFIDSLLRKIAHPSQAFADDFKFIADVITHSEDIIQNEINIVVHWADERGTPLSIEKCCVLYCGPVQTYNAYHIKSIKATRICGMIRHIFPSGHRNLLWPAFQLYVLPFSRTVLLYGAHFSNVI